MHQSIILVHALQSQWLMMHVRVFGKNSHSLIGPFSFDFDEIQYVNERSNAMLNNSLLSFRNYHRYQLIQQLDRWSYRVISLGFIFLTVGILSGAVWANDAWGHKFRNLASMGFLIIWVCYFGVNLLGIGLHSYGSFTLAS
ncbi:hypothetical protein MKW92_021160 [Papaver armeniacum]|nr:hypothetical protein MKW92_021160 [Papaver armeniacum]